MHDEPRAASLLETSRPAKPSLAGLSTLQRATCSIKTVREGNIVRDDNLQVANFEIDALYCFEIVVRFFQSANVDSVFGIHRESGTQSMAFPVARKK